MSTFKMVKSLKENGQDFEWYPTTREIIEAMYWDLNGKKIGEETYRAEGKHISLLDIGAGNCKLLATFKEIADEQPMLNEYYERSSDSRSFRSKNERLANRVQIHQYMAIEKSQILLDNMPSEAIVVGTDFNENTLIDKRADIVFCNPPYSQYAQWSEKIIKESNAKCIYLVIPQRWGKNRAILEAIRKRKAQISVVGVFDFENSEDRKARAKVSLLKINLAHHYESLGYRRDETPCNVDPFELWFDETFKINAQKADDNYKTRSREHQQQRENIKNQIVKGGDLVSTLVELYNKELEKLMNNYLKVAELDADILKELNVDATKLQKALMEKIKGLKCLYWQEIFDNLTEITSRLTSSTRGILLKKLAANTNIDFTAGNIRSVVIWVLKNANSYFESQMLFMYDKFTSKEGISLYKSNAHWKHDTWRYCQELKDQGVKYALDYRIVLEGYFSELDIRDGFIPESRLDSINDLLIIARNLYFETNGRDIRNKKIKLGSKENIYFWGRGEMKLNKGAKTIMGRIQDVHFVEDEGYMQYQIDGTWYHESAVLTEEDIFTTVKGFKNGNIHYQLNQKFIKKLNLEVARIRGWIKSPKEAAEEFDITEEEAISYWNSSFQLLPAHVQNLLPQKPTEKPDSEAENANAVEMAPENGKPAKTATCLLDFLDDEVA